MEQSRTKPTALDLEFYEDQTSASLTRQQQVPTAQLVSIDEAVPGIPLAEGVAVPATEFSYREEEQNRTVRVQDAIPIPTGQGHSNYRDRALASTAGRIGLIHAEQERESIQKANQDVGAINYFANAAVEESNRAALDRNRAEELGYAQTSKSVVKEVVKPQPKKEQEFFPGTYGKDFETSPYEVNEYDTREYETSTYKSVYES